MTDSKDRSATISRETEETVIECTIDIDGSGEGNVRTGIGFFDHMLDSFATHGLFDIDLQCSGDLEVDSHHSVEDVAIVVGTAIDNALGDRRGIVRYSDRRIPLDEAIASVVVDVSGRSRFYFDGDFSQEAIGGFSSVLAKHFVESLAMNAGLTIHASIEGENAHHEAEALFKAIARALGDATRIDPRRSDTPSTKGKL